MALDRRKIEREGKAEGEKRSRVIARSVDDLSLLRCCGVTLTYRSGIWRKKFAAEENNNTRGEKENGKVCALLNYNMYRRRCTVLFQGEPARADIELIKISNVTPPPSFRKRIDPDSIDIVAFYAQKLCGGDRKIITYDELLNSFRFEN